MAVFISSTNLSSHPCIAPWVGFELEVLIFALPAIGLSFLRFWRYEDVRTGADTF